VPLYDYVCAACGRRFEVIHGLHDDPPTSCPLCGKGPVRKAFAAPAIHFKGSGWAKKERRAAKAGAASGSSAGSGGDGSGGDGSGGDSSGDGGSPGDKGGVSPDKSSSPSKGAGPTSRSTTSSTTSGSTGD
jgi:putative FmdB family regulatory protein